MLSTLFTIHCSQKQSECEDGKQESFSSIWRTEIPKILKPKRCHCVFWSSYPKAEVWQTCTLSNYCAHLSSKLFYTVLPRKIFFFFKFGILFYENCDGIVGRRGAVVKTGVQSHPRKVGRHRSTVPAQLSVKSSPQWTQGLCQQLGENQSKKIKWYIKSPAHCSNGSPLQTQGFLCKTGCEVVPAHNLNSSVMPLLIILCGSKQIFALILLSFPFL